MTYVVQVHTGTREGASTDADIYVYLYGDECTHNGTFLDTPDWDDFEPGQTDQFMFDRRSVGDVSHSIFMQFLCTETWVHDGDLNTDESQLGGGGGGGGGEGADWCEVQQAD